MKPTLYCLSVLSSKRAVDESEMEAAERRSLRCVWVTGGRALTEQEAAVEIVSEARLLLQEDLAQLGVQWDPTTLPPGAPAVNSPNDSDTSSASHEAQLDNSKDHQEGDGVEKSRSRDIDRHGGENKEEYKHETGTSKPEDTVVNRQLEEHREENSTETEIRQTDNNAQVKRSKETKNDTTNKQLLTTEDPVEKCETQKQAMSKQGGEEHKKAEPKEGETSKVSIRAESHQAGPVPERSLTQELAEIVSSPFLQPMPHPQPSSSPMPPPRFRTPVSRVEEQHSVPTDGATGPAASPVYPGRLKHSRVLSKVLHSIQTDKQDNVETHSKPTVVSSVRHSSPAGHVPTTVQAAVPVLETPTNADSPLSVSPASIPLFSPEAKRRRMDGGDLDKFSSPELYAGDEEAEGDVKKGEESFGDSFELDTQTERIIVQQACERRDDRDTSPSVETEKIREEEMVEAAVELDKDTDEAPDNACPRFNISLTDSQMELILNTSHQVSDHNHPITSDFKHYMYSHTHRCHL